MVERSAPFMNLFALLSHTLAQQARSPASHRFRMGSLLLVTWLLVVAHYSASMYEGVGRELIRMLTGLDMLLIVVAGSSHFGSVITEEKEQGTLGLLKLAGFSNLGLLLGKSSGRVLSALSLFVMQLPFAFLGVMLGGVSPQQVVAAFVALAAFMILIGNLGLFYSLICRRNSLAVSLTTLTGMLIVWGDGIIAFILTAGLPKRIGWMFGGLQWIESRVRSLSIDDQLRTIIAVRGTPVIGEQFGWSLLISVGLFVAAWILFDRFTESVESVGLERRDSTRKWRLWSATHVWQDAIAWKDFHFPAGGWILWSLKALIFAGIVIAGVLFEAQYRLLAGGDLRMLVAYACLGICVLEVLIFAGNLFGEEYQAGTLPNLLLIPRPLGRMVWSKLWGGSLMLLPGMLAAIAAVAVAGPDRLYDGPQMRLLAWGAGFVLLLHLTVFYSLKVKRGALAWAVASLIIGGAMLLPALKVATAMLLGETRYRGDINGPEAWAPLIYVATFACVSLQIAIVVAIHQAGEEG